jgi:hypothetical protein
LKISFTRPYDPVLGEVHDRYNGGSALRDWQDERSNNVMWLAVSGGAVLIGIILLTGSAPSASRETKET